jgi:ribose transport system ATP-binding protein
MYEGAIKRELAGEAITEKALIASALNIETEEAGLAPVAGA